MNKFTAIHNNTHVQCEIIATFSFRQKTYAYYTSDYKTMQVAIVDNGNLVEITNPNEYTFVETIYKKLKNEPEFKTHFIEYGPVFYNDKEYKTIFDMKEKRRYFYELINDKYQEVTGNLKNYFDEIYNKDIDVMFLGENENRNEKLSKITKKVVKVGKVAITVIIIGNLAFTPLKTIDLNKSFMQNVTQIMEIYKVDENDAKTIMSYISNNDRLAQDDKEFLMSLRHFFVENES